MAESPVVTGLLAKRAEFAGLILHHQKQIVILEAHVGHLDATLKIFAPELDLRTLRPKEYRQRNTWFRPRECPRLILEVYRDAGGAALGSRKVALALLARKGLDSTPALIDTFQKTALRILRDLERAGTLLPADHDGRGLAWRLA